LREKKIPEKGRVVFAEEVERDPKNEKVLWVRIQYFKDGELLHDVRFIPTSLKSRKEWVRIAEPRIFGSFIPKNRYRPMFKKAMAIMYSASRKRDKPASQLELPFPKPLF